MFEKKFNWKIYFFLVFLGGILWMAMYVVFLMATNQVGDENGAPLPRGEVGLLCFLICLVCSTYAVTFFTLLKQVIVHKSTAFRVDEAGIHNTLVCLYVLAFVIVCPVKQIPWSAVSSLEHDERGISIRVKRGQVSTSRVGRLILGLLGYHFCYSFTTTKLSQEEQEIISTYCGNSPTLNV